MQSKHSPLTVVVGLGKTGQSCVDYCVRHKIPVIAMDTRENPPDLSEVKKKYPELKIHVGSLDQTLLNQATRVLLSPGVSLEEPAIQNVLAKNIPVIGDIELFAQTTQAPVCAITGSNAKSTVTTLVAEMAKQANIPAACGGNIGTPALDLLNGTTSTFYVLELSSFQLETIDSLKPAVATILNISADHMDRYHSLNDYIAAKQRIYHNSNTIVFNRADQNTFPREKNHTQTVLSFGLDAPKDQQAFGIHQQNGVNYLSMGDERLLAVDEILLKGQHNWENALAALALGYALSIPMSAMLETLKKFPGLAHRCEFVLEQNGVSWVNDSKGTNVGATKAAIEGLAKTINGSIVLIAGGLAKNADLAPLQTSIAEHVKALVLIGKDAPRFQQQFARDTEIFHAKDMRDAVSIAARLAHAGDAVLLSPACASFDMFKHFEHRGDVFKDEVRTLFK